MIHLPLIVFGVVLVLIGLGRLAQTTREYRRAQRDEPEVEEYDRERSLNIAIASVTLIFGGCVVVFIGLQFAGGALL